MISILDFLYLVLAFGLIPVFVLLTGVLWRAYQALGRVNRISAFVEQGVNFISQFDKIPALVVDKVSTHVAHIFAKEKGTHK